MNELVVKDNVTIIDGNTKISSIKNKNSYTKLIIRKKINPIRLNVFKNVKELEIDDVYYNEERIDKLSFNKKLEKLVLKEMKVLGIKDDKSGWGTINYELSTPNLKILELPSILKNINKEYINNLEKLETIIFNVSSNTNCNLNKDSEHKPLLLPNNLNKFIVKTDFNNYKIDFDYKPKYLSLVEFSSEGIKVNYNNDFINTEVIIDNDKINKTNILKDVIDELIIDKCLYIQDYINDLNIEKKSTIKEINSISINPKKLHLNEILVYRNINQYLKNIDKIIIRDCNEMKLNPNIELKTEDYGKLIAIYIENKKLYIKFSSYTFIIDGESNIEKCKYARTLETEEKQNEINNEDNVRITTNEETSENTNILDKKYNNLNTYSSKELEYYTYYKKLLELLTPDSDEVKSAFVLVESELIKKLKM